MGEGDQWAALDSQYERLVDTSMPLPVIQATADPAKRDHRRIGLTARTELARRGRRRRHRV
jgi:hypothetical protein